jgi:hypothetical protein
LIDPCELRLEVRSQDAVADGTSGERFRTILRDHSSSSIGSRSSGCALIASLLLEECFHKMVKFRALRVGEVHPAAAATTDERTTPVRHAG